MRAGKRWLTALPDHRPDDLSRAALFHTSGVNGRSRRRAPVASKMALPIAAGVTVIAVSPAPVAGTPAALRKRSRSAGIRNPGAGCGTSPNRRK